ncbi:cyclase family protein [Halocatena halophila]|uniref:cyclase family protein n=1 Tax=Halocatena halophila TaxID=2814576 RepID=UPI002ED038A6
MDQYRLHDVTMWMDAFDFEGDQPFEISGPFNRVEGSNPEYVYDLELSTQTGTHIQGAHYFNESGKRIEEYPLQQFEGRAILCDLEDRGVDTTAAFFRSRFDEGDLKNAILILRTGHMEDVIERGELDPAHRPGLSPGAARYLVEETQLRMIAIDSVGVESRETENFEVNVYLGEHDILILEGLVNLDAITATAVFLEAFPLKIPGVEGTPCRAIIKEPLEE